MADAVTHPHRRVQELSAELNRLRLERAVARCRSRFYEHVLAEIAKATRYDSEPAATLSSIGSMAEGAVRGEADNG